MTVSLVTIRRLAARVGREEASRTVLLDALFEAFPEETQAAINRARAVAAARDYPVAVAFFPEALSRAGRRRVGPPFELYWIWNSPEPTTVLFPVPNTDPEPSIRRFEAILRSFYRQPVVVVYAAREPIVLHVWSQEGGVSRAWRGPGVTAADPFFLFGPHGGGWSPFGRMDDRQRERAEIARAEAERRFGPPVELVFGPAPPEDGDG